MKWIWTSLLLFVHDPSMPDAAWYNSLSLNGHKCCDNDCIIAEEFKSAEPPGAYWVKTNIEWVYVPKDKVLERNDNPTGMPVVCVWHSDSWAIARCFILPAEG